MLDIYDMIIIGAGPAGFTAGIYARRAGLSVLMIEKTMPGGAVAITSEVCNYPGFQKIGGAELANLMFEHATSLGVETIFEEVSGTDFSQKIKVVKTYNGTYKARTVIICLGAATRKLAAEGEKAFFGKGISYCATCDGNLYKDKTVAVVGGGNSALEDAVYMSNIAKKVYLIHRRDEFRGDDILVKDVKAQKNVELVLCAKVNKVEGNGKLEDIIVENIPTKQTSRLDIDGLFVSIGRGPDTEVIDKSVAISETGYIVTDEKMRTSVDGVFAAGDIRQSPLKQIVTACSDGAIAATAAFQYIKSNK